jgi:hypothetical protein
MVMARAHYVHGKQRAFPYGERLVSGPFDTSADATTERKRLEAAGLYPDARLTTTTHRAKSLPVVTPRTRPPGAEPPAGPTYDLRKRPERERLAAALAERARAFGATVHIENWDGEPDVQIRTPSLQANIWLAYLREAPMPIISWYGAAYPLRAVPGAWTDDDRRRKASSLPATWPELFDMLETGICAAIDGSAFDLEEAKV